MKKIIVFCVAFLATMSLWASETIVKNAYGVEIWYDFDNESKTASVVASNGEKYTGEVVIPSTVTYGGEEYSVTSIGERAFYGCSSLTSVMIPESVTSIGKLAFYGCSSLTSLTIPEGVTEIGEKAFDGCCRLYEVYNKSNLTITAGSRVNGNVAYYAKKVYPDDSVESKLHTVGDYIFYVDEDNIELLAYIGDKIAITLPSDYEGKDYIIANYGFSDYSTLTSITIPKGVTSIGKRAFSDCSSLTSITIPKGVTKIGTNTFFYCSSLTSITIPESVTSIGYGAFRNCSSLTSIKIPEGVTSIGSYAFNDCSSLTSITIPEGVTEIGDYAFFGCSSLTSITCKNTTPPILIIEGIRSGARNFTFDGVDKSIPLYVPAESVEAYKNAKYWKEFTNIQAIPSSSVANAKAETQDSVRKEYRDGQVLIIKGDKTYTMFGTEY